MRFGARAVSAAASNGKRIISIRSTVPAWIGSSASWSRSPTSRPSSREYAFHPGIVDPLRQIFNDDVALFEDKLNLKLPGGSPYPWHQDWACCWRAHTDELITCFIYLDDADATMGCLQVIPGQPCRQADPALQGGQPLRDRSGRASSPSKAVPVPLPAGGMIYFDPYLLHYSDFNTTNRPRRTIIFTYNPARLGSINEGRFPDDRAR